jgi:hypothetical protein
MEDELERIWKEAAMAQSRYHGGTEENHENLLAEIPTEHLPITNVDVGFEVFTAVVMKSIIFWDMTPCSVLSGTRRFGGTSDTTLRNTRRHIPEEDTLHKFRWLPLDQPIL